MTKIPLTDDVLTSLKPGDILEFPSGLYMYLRNIERTRQYIKIERLCLEPYGGYPIGSIKTFSVWRGDMTGFFLWQFPTST